MDSILSDSSREIASMPNWTCIFKIGADKGSTRSVKNRKGDVKFIQELKERHGRISFMGNIYNMVIPL